MPDFPIPPLRRPLGKALRRTAEERRRLATIGPADMVNARMMWHETAPDGWQRLIEARVEPEKS
jgi:hypothetical protein